MQRRGYARQQASKMNMRQQAVGSWACYQAKSTGRQLPRWWWGWWSSSRPPRSWGHFVLWLLSRECNPLPELDPIVKTDDETHVPGGYEDIYYAHHEVFWYSRASSQVGPFGFSEGANGFDFYCGWQWCQWDGFYMWANVLTFPLVPAYPDMGHNREWRNMACTLLVVK